MRFFAGMGCFGRSRGWNLPPIRVLKFVKATAVDLRLFQRVWLWYRSNDAQSKHEDGHSNQDAHFAQVVVVGETCVVEVLV